MYGWCVPEQRLPAASQNLPASGARETMMRFI
jgi:hypothetical protein